MSVIEPKGVSYYNNSQTAYKFRLQKKSLIMPVNALI